MGLQEACSSDFQKLGLGWLVLLPPVLLPNHTALPVTKLKLLI